MTAGIQDLFSGEEGSQLFHKLRVENRSCAMTSKWQSSG